MITFKTKHKEKAKVLIKKEITTKKKEKKIQSNRGTCSRSIVALFGHSETILRLSEIR